MKSFDEFKSRLNTQDSKWVSREYLGGPGSKQEWKKPNATYKRYDTGLRYLTSTHLESPKAEERHWDKRTIWGSNGPKTFQIWWKNNPQIQEIKWILNKIDTKKTSSLTILKLVRENP